MYPTLDISDQLAVEKVPKHTKPFQRNEVVVFNPPKTFRDVGLFSKKVPCILSVKDSDNQGKSNHLAFFTINRRYSLILLISNTFATHHLFSKRSSLQDYQTKKCYVYFFA